PSKYRFTAWIFSFEENLAIKNAPPIVRLCLTIGVHFIMDGFCYVTCVKLFENNDRIIGEIVTIFV
ncbi:hypothetical protein PDN49_23975, partial [Bacillus cereus]|uniref:hypothetical protein n=1 Tax=Bacillus cereus group sp. BfR-BA-01347 TaxID=2920310 RepID=UPI001F5A14B8